MNLLNYEPLIKGRGFEPNPVYRWGIPDFADSIQNPKCVGTVAHEDYWLEQIDRCVNGYWSAGVFIPGRYYYYLNFNKLLTIGRGYHLPEYVDLDLEFFDLVDFCKAQGKHKDDSTAGGKGIIMPKRRRAGVTHKISQGIFSHGVRFHSGGYKAGVVSGHDVQSAGFFSKFKENESRLPPEFQLKAMSDEDKWIACYEKRSPHGSFIRDGSFNTIFCRTAFSNENVFKGEILNDCDFEEGGEFDKLMSCFSSTSACFMAGMQMKGTAYVQATGGKMKRGTADFKKLLEQAEIYDLIPFDILGPRMMIGVFIGSINADDKLEEDCPYIKEKYKDLAPEQILGCEDVRRAEEKILAKRDQLKKATNKEKYYEYLQDNPLSRKDVFLNFTANPFDVDILANRMHEISNSFLKYKKVKLEWVVDKDGARVVPYEVKVVDAKDEDEESDCCLMHIEHKPLPNHKNLDVAGCDSYDLDQSATSKSLGGFCITRRRDPGTGEIIKKPIFVIRMRPKRKEVFYDNCLKACVLYNLQSNCLIDVANGLIFSHFVNNNGKKYLAPRPKAFESPDSEQQHAHGVKMTTHNKPQIIAMAQSWVNDHAQGCDFPHILAELNEYNADQVDSDWDLADALMLSLLRDIDLKKAPQDMTKNKDVDDGRLGMWHSVNGVMVEVRNGEAPAQPKWEPGFGPQR